MEAPIKLISAKWIGVKSSVCVYLDCWKASLLSTHSVRLLLCQHGKHNPVMRTHILTLTITHIQAHIRAQREAEICSA